MSRVARVLSRARTRGPRRSRSRSELRPVRLSIWCATPSPQTRSDVPEDGLTGTASRSDTDAAPVAATNSIDPRGKKITILLGVHFEAGLFVSVDPRMHSPTWFPRSVEFRTGDLDAAKAHGWHGWERERSDTRPKVKPEESLLTETVVAFRSDQFLRYIEFERLASGLDCGERCLLSDRIEQRLARGTLPTAPGGHPLEIRLGLPASDILDVAMARIRRS